MPLIVFLAVILSLMTLTARADDGAEGGAEGGPGPLALAAAGDPEEVLDDVADLIAGYGEDGGLTAAGIAAHVGLTRAAARAQVLRGFVAGDLDGDGTLAGDEVAVAMAAMTARARMRLARDVAAADRDGDGALSWAEQRAAAEAAALVRLDAEEAGLLAALMMLDSDLDGMLTMPEAKDGLRALAAAGDGGA